MSSNNSIADIVTKRKRNRNKNKKRTARDATDNRFKFKAPFNSLEPAQKAYNLVFKDVNTLNNKQNNNAKSKIDNNGSLQKNLTPKVLNNFKKQVQNNKPILAYNNSNNNNSNNNNSNNNNSSKALKNIRNTKTFGANLTRNAKTVSSQIEDFSKKFKTINQKYREDISKYKKMTELNKKLSASYLMNLNAMMDISKLLTQYVGFFNIIKQELATTTGDLSTVSVFDVEYVENLTRAKLQQFNENFIKETDKIKKLYGRSDDEYKMLESSQKSISQVMNAASKLKQSI